VEPRRILIVLSIAIGLLLSSDLIGEGGGTPLRPNVASAASGALTVTPPNHGFNSLDLWHDGAGSDNFSIGTGGPTGSYLSIGFNSKLVSEAFTLTSTEIEFDFAFPINKDNRMLVAVVDADTDLWMEFVTYGCDDCTLGWTRQVLTGLDPGDVGTPVYVEILHTGTSSTFYGETSYDNVAANQLTAGTGLSFPAVRTQDPVSTSTGEFSHSHTDIAVPGKGVPLGFTRTYSAMSDLSGDLGVGWTHNYAFSLRIDNDDSVRVRYPDGHRPTSRRAAGAIRLPMARSTLWSRTATVPTR
jgi:hypothetical protein